MILEIQSLTHVILRALQRKFLHDALDRTLTFGEIWKACDAAIDNLPGRIKRSEKPLPRDNSRFAAEMFEEIQFLEDMNFITRHVAGGKLQSIRLTDIGAEYVRKTVFSHQERAPEPSTNHHQWKAQFE